EERAPRVIDDTVLTARRPPGVMEVCKCTDELACSKRRVLDAELARRAPALVLDLVAEPLRHRIERPPRIERERRARTLIRDLLLAGEVHGEQLRTVAKLAELQTIPREYPQGVLERA